MSTWIEPHSRLSALKKKNTKKNTLCTQCEVILVNFYEEWACVNSNYFIQGVYTEQTARTYQSLGQKTWFIHLTEIQFSKFPVNRIPTDNQNGKKKKIISPLGVWFITVLLQTGFCPSKNLYSSFLEVIEQYKNMYHIQSGNIQLPEHLSEEAGLVSLRDGVHPEWPLQTSDIASCWAAGAWDMPQSSLRTGSGPVVCFIKGLPGSFQFFVHGQEVFNPGKLAGVLAD